MNWWFKYIYNAFYLQITSPVWKTLVITYYLHVTGIKSNLDYGEKHLENSTFQNGCIRAKWH